MSKVADRCEAVSVTPDADRPATRYIEAGAVSDSFAADAYHVAIAVVCGADVIVSWNFRHIVRRKTRDIVNMVNTLHGYAHIEIVAPGELLYAVVEPLPPHAGDGVPGNFRSKVFWNRLGGHVSNGERRMEPTLSSLREV